MIWIYQWRGTYDSTQPGGTHELSMAIQGALTRGDQDAPWEIEVQETWVRKQQSKVDVGLTTLYPQVRESLTFQLDKTPPAAPTGYVGYGEILFTDQASGEIWLRLPMFIP